jgi:hypothetical protein
VNDLKLGVRWTALVLADVLALLRLRPDWAQLMRDVTAPHLWLERVGADRAVLSLATAALWCVALWLAVGLGFLAAAALPGRAGAAAQRAAARLLPGLMLRAVAGVVGLGMVVAPIAPVGAGAKTMPAAVAAAGTSGVPAPGWPTDPNRVPSLHVGWPTTPTARPTPTPRPTPTARRAVPASDGQADPANSAPLPGDQLRVRPGDSLWLIAAQRLGSDSSDPLIAAEWPRWYAANRSVIGTDPSLIHPGQVLRAPGPPNPNR